MQLVFGIAGAAVGSMFGMPQLGWAVGSAIGGAMSQQKQNVQGPRLGDLSVQASTYGAVQPIIFGTWRVAGNVIFCTDKREVANTQEFGKGGPSGSSTTYTYNVDIAIHLSARTIAGIRKIYSNGKLIYDVSMGADIGTVIASSTRSADFKLYRGTEDQMPDPTIEATVGAGNAPAYRGSAYVVFTQLDCPNGQIPQLSFEVMGDSVGGYQRREMVRFPAPVNTLGNGDFVAHIYKEGGEQFLVPAAATPPPLHVSAWEFGVGYINRTGQYEYPTIYSSGPNKSIAVSGGARELVYLTYDRPLDSSTSSITMRSYDPVTGVVSNVYRVGATGDTIGAYNWAAFDPYSKTFAAAPNPASSGNIIWGERQILKKPGYGGGPIAFTGGVLYSMPWLGAEVSAWDPELQEWGNGIPIPWTGGITQVLLGGNSDVLHVLIHYSGDSSGGVWRLEDGAFVLICDDITIYNANGTPTSTGSWYTFYADEDIINVGPSLLNSGEFVYTTIVLQGVDPVDVPVASVIQDLAIRAGMRADQLDLDAVEDLVHGYAVTGVSSARANIDPLLKCFFLDAQESDGKLKFRPRASLTPVATIAFDDLAAVEAGGENGDPFALQRTMESELPRSMSVTFVDQNFDYQAATESSRRIVTSSVNDAVESLPVAITSTHAADVADGLLYDAWNARNQRAFITSRKHADLDAGDVVLVEYPRGTFSPKRLVSASDTGVLCEFACVDFDGEIYTVDVPGTTTSSGQSGVALLPFTRMEALDIPLLRDVDSDPGIYVALDGTTVNWPGAQLFIGADDATLTSRGAVTRNTEIGVAATALGDWTAGTVDQVNTVVIDLGAGELYSATRDAVLNDSANLALVGDEILQFTTASALGGGRWLLTGFVRGLRGTERATATHRIGERFVLLQFAGMLRPPFDLSELGSPRVFRPVTAGRALGSQASVAVVNTGEALRPLSPVNARRSMSGASTVLAWDRRSRLSQNLSLGTVPLGETTERYAIELYTDGIFTLLAGVLASTEPTITITAAEQTALGLAPGATLHVRIMQVSESVGNGHPLQKSL